MGTGRLATTSLVWCGGCRRWTPHCRPFKCRKGKAPEPVLCQCGATAALGGDRCLACTQVPVGVFA